MQFQSVKIKGVKADVVSKLITIGFTLPLNDENLAVAEELSRYADKNRGHCAVVITPAQLAFTDARTVMNRETG